MSNTTVEIDKSSGLKAVIVRGYGSEPARLIVVSKDSDGVCVAGEDLTKPLNLPRSAVYNFDAELFEDLRSAYERRDSKKLQALWSKATHFRG